MAEDLVKKRARSLRWDAKNRQRNAERGRSWYAANRARARATRKAWRLRNAKKDRADIAAYQAAHPEEMAINSLVQVAARRARKKQATPKWADRKAIRAIYAARKAAEELFGIMVQVDHVVPLKSDLVCGLHCEANLELLTGKANAEKHNSFWPDMWI